MRQEASARNVPAMRVALEISVLQQRLDDIQNSLDNKVDTSTWKGANDDVDATLKMARDMALLGRETAASTMQRMVDMDTNILELRQAMRALGQKVDSSIPRPHSEPPEEEVLSLALRWMAKERKITQEDADLMRRMWPHWRKRTKEVKTGA